MTPGKQGAIGSDAGPNRRVLVVDDDDQVRRYLASLLRGSGYVVDEARNGTEAVGRFQSNPPACVLIDLQMPGMNGIDAIIAMNPRQSGIPVIAMSGIPFERESEPRQLAKVLGADRFFPKPVDGGSLLAAIRELTDGPG